MIRKASYWGLFVTVIFSAHLHAQDDGSVLPFPPQPMDSVVKPSLQDSTMKWPNQQQRLPADAPNILVVLIDDVGFGVSEVFGGEVKTPALKKLAAEGHSVQRVSYHGDLFSHAGVPVDRTQSHPSRLRNDCRAGDCVRWLHRRHAADRRDGGGGAAPLRLQDIGLWQMAQHSRDRNHLDGSLRSLAHRLWL